MARIGYGSVEQADNAATELRTKIASVARPQAGLANLRQEIDVLQYRRDLADAERRRALAVRHQTELKRISRNWLSI